MFRRSTPIYQFPPEGSQRQFTFAGSLRPAESRRQRVRLRTVCGWVEKCCISAHMQSVDTNICSICCSCHYSTDSTVTERGPRHNMCRVKQVRSLLSLTGNIRSILYGEYVTSAVLKKKGYFVTWSCFGFYFTALDEFADSLHSILKNSSCRLLLLFSFTSLFLSQTHKEGKRMSLDEINKAVETNITLSSAWPKPLHQELN